MSLEHPYNIERLILGAEVSSMPIGPSYPTARVAERLIAAEQCHGEEPSVVLDEVVLIGGHAPVMADHTSTGQATSLAAIIDAPAQGSRAKLSSTQFVDTGTPLSPTAEVQDLTFVTGAVSGDRELPCCRERCARYRTGPARAGSVLTYGRPKCDLAAEPANRSPTTQIYEGTNQIQRMVMARQLLK